MQNVNFILVKDIPNYPGYQATNIGQIISCNRKIIIQNKINNYTCYRQIKQRILKPTLDKYGYFHVILSINNKQMFPTVHSLIMIAFKGKRPNGYQINHIDFNKQNNNELNLDYVTARQNSVHYTETQPSSSIYAGISWHEPRKKWVASASINSKKTHLGYFKTQLEAHYAREKVLKKLNE